MSQSISQVSNLALEYWRASGERTAERLDELVEHFATVYGQRDQLLQFQDEARRVAGFQ